MAHVNKRLNSFTCTHRHPRVHPQLEWTIPIFTPQPHSVTALWQVLISVPLRVEGWVGVSGWLQTEVVYPIVIGHPSRAPRTVTSLIETNALSLSQAA